MDIYSYRKQPYKAGLANLTTASTDMLPPLYMKKKREPTLQKQQQQQEQQLRSLPTPIESHQDRYKMHTEAMDLDSDIELDNALIQSASRVTRRHPVKLPFLSPSSSSSSKKTNGHGKTTTSKMDPVSPFYSTVIEPPMNLGQQWPPRSTTFKRVVDGDKWHPPMKKETTTTSLLKRMTAQLLDTYGNQNPQFKYKSDAKPKRILTKPCKEARNDGYDNEDYDYILKVNDILGEEKEYQYRVIDLLGQGTFGQVVKCERVTTGELFSVKVIKNKVAYREQSRMEVEILKQLKSKLDSKAQKHILTLHHTFTHKNHFCLVFELLSFNLYELIKQNQFKGLSINLVRVFTLQLLDTLILLKDAKIIHCDLKPENILLTSFDTPMIKIIDFGSACHEANRIYTYIQSRFYRSPEVLLGLQYTGAIDMWSLGCIVAELFIGIPLFPGSSEYNQLRRIVDMMGMPPQDMLDKGSNSSDFFNKEDNGNGKHIYVMKSLEQYGLEHKKTELPGKKYYPQTELPDLILQTKSGHRSPDNPEQDLEHRHAMIDFLQGLLELNPLKRWTPKQARYHPFVTGQPFTEPYNPNNLARKQSSMTKKSLNHSTKSTISALHPVESNANNSSSSITSTKVIHHQENASKDTIRTLEQQVATSGHRRTDAISNISSQTRRPRAQSMNAPTGPSQMHELVLDMKAHPIVEHQPQSSFKGNKQQTSNSDIDDARLGWYKHRQSRSQGDLIGLLSPESYHPSSSKEKEIKDNSTNDMSELFQKHTFYNNNNNATDDQVLPQPTTLRKVKIAPNVKIRIGSQEPYRHTENGSTITPGDSSSTSSGSNIILQINNNNNPLVRTNGGDWITESTLSSLHLPSSTRSKPKGRFSHEGEAAGGLLMMRQDKNDPFVSSSISSSKRVAAAIKRRTMLGST